MNYKSAVKELLQEYEKKRDLANAKRKEREAIVCAELPRVAEIDRELAETNMKLAKLALQHTGDKQSLLQTIEVENERLLSEKRELLKANGYPEEYLSAVYACSFCKDTGFVESQKCRCFKQKLIEKYIRISNLSKAIKDENFDTFDFRYYRDEADPQTGISPNKNMKSIFMLCNEFIRNFDSSSENFYFYGSPGLGKTFLCNCIAKDILDRGHTVLYVTAAETFKVIEGIRFEKENYEEFSEFVDMVYSVELLIIDDLGTEFSTIVTQTELFNIINNRMLNKKHTIISSNLSPADLESHYSERLCSRLIGNYKMLKFVGDDIRIKKKYKRL